MDMGNIFTGNSIEEPKVHLGMVTVSSAYVAMRDIPQDLWEQMQTRYYEHSNQYSSFESKMFDVRVSTAGYYATLRAHAPGGQIRVATST